MKAGCQRADTKGKRQRQASIFLREVYHCAETLSLMLPDSRAPPKVTTAKLEDILTLIRYMEERS